MGTSTSKKAFAMLIPFAMILLGVLLIVAEVYLIPGFNVIGILGALIMLAAVTMAFLESGVIGGITAMAGASLTTSGTLWWMWKSGAWDRFVLSSSLKTDEHLRAHEGARRAQYLGTSGIAVTPLRPTGFAEIEGERLEVATEGSFIPAGSRVKIVSMDGRNYFVRLSDESETTREA